MTHTAGSSGRNAGGTAAAGGVLAATCVSTLVVNANTSAVTILLPAISEDTGSSLTTLQWAVTGYSLVGAAVLTAVTAWDDTGRPSQDRPTTRPRPQPRPTPFRRPLPSTSTHDARQGRGADSAPRPWRSGLPFQNLTVFDVLRSSICSW
jgi:hypothetical protein